MSLKVEPLDKNLIDTEDFCEQELIRLTGELLAEKGKFRRMSLELMKTKNDFNQANR